MRLSRLFAGPPAQAQEAPWCAAVDIGTGNVRWECEYYSIEACRRHVLAGNRGFCNLNPRYRGPERRYEEPRRYRR